MLGKVIAGTIWKIKECAKDKNGNNVIINDIEF